jgi:ferric-dicitrate binding protein FerR (iron transport regulator)
VLLITVLPASLMANEQQAAMLHNNGGVFLNGSAAPQSSALEPDDTVQTQRDSIATIDANGSTVTVNPDTLLQFEGDEIYLEHGTLLVNTSTGLRVRVGCLTVIPVNQAWTQYDVTDVDGKVTVFAHKNDVNIETRGSKSSERHEAEQRQRVTVREGEQHSREEKCGAAAAKPPSYVSGRAAILNTWQAKGIGLAAIGTLTCWALCRSGNPASPSQP